MLDYLGNAPDLCYGRKRIRLLYKFSDILFIRIAVVISAAKNKNPKKLVFIAKYISFAVDNYFRKEIAKLYF